MIMEEMNKIKKANEIRARLAVVKEELNRLKEESVDEVEVGGTRKGSEYYEKGAPVAKFEKIGTHLKEDEPMIGDDQVPETFEEKLAAIGRELDMKLASMDGDDMGGEDVAADVDADVDADAGIEAADDMEADADSVEAPAAADDEALKGDGEEEGEDEIEIDEASIEVEKAGDPFLEKPKDGMNKMDGVGTKTVSEEAEVKEETEVKEEAEEECETMEEDKKPMNESRDVLGKKTNPLLSKELDRMRKLANL